MEIFQMNLESGMPTVETALVRMRQGLFTAKSRGAGAAKLIHGYGSSGTGGKIKAGVHRELAAMQRAGKIHSYIKGEDFSPFDETARKAVDRIPALARDRDYSRQNHGITVVVL